MSDTHETEPEQSTAAGSRAEPLVGRVGCPDLDPDWPGLNGRPLGPRLCCLYPRCKCGREDGYVEPGFLQWSSSRPG
jgi:hypothetical protein